jgi:eukaryotic-like serine/threonine-protein kinase
MLVQSAAGLADALRQLRLLDSARLDELARVVLPKFPDPKTLARELVRRGWLTTYQVNQLFKGHGNDLLLGSYVVLERLGEGGMGQVFKARNWKMGQIVALKVIRKERLANEVAVLRFEREIRAASQLDHPNIVRALDADRAGESHFLVMEYIEGIDLARIVRERGPLSVAIACDFARQAALALQHAHERGLVHRDVKPANLLLAQAPGLRDAGLVKVLDMGLARVDMTTDGVSLDTLTKEGSVMGSLDYIAPEQAMNSHTVDIRGDLYGLGCTLYYLLTGQVPFPTPHPMEKLLSHRMSEPIPVEEQRPEVSPAVGAVIRRLMAKLPEDRYQTPAEAAEALAAATVARGRTPRESGAAPVGAVSAGAAPIAAETADTTVTWSSLMEPPVAEETAAGPPPRLRRRRGPWLGAAAAVVLAVLIALIAVLVRLSGPPPPGTKRASTHRVTTP